MNYLNKIIVVSLFCIVACNNNQHQQTQLDIPSKGTIFISVDESFKPVIEQQIRVYRASYPEANIIASYKAEVDCFKDLQQDSTRMIIVARGLNKNEADYYTAKLSYKPEDDVLAYDAVAIIININSNDSLFTIQRIKTILGGKENITAIMDGNNATSTVRYLNDSVMHGSAFGKNVVAVNGSQAVIDAVANNKNAIGFVGLGWVGNNQEPAQQAQLKKIKLALVECVKCNENGYFAKPSQSTITFSQYPLARPLYFILKENAVNLGTGFKNFLSLERGQLIFRRSYFAPAKMDFKKRNSNIKES